MTNQPKDRVFLTDKDLARIADLWRRYRELKSLRDSALPPTAKGAWIHEAATLQMELIARDLEKIYEETYPWLPSELDD